MQILSETATTIHQCIRVSNLVTHQGVLKHRDFLLKTVAWITMENNLNELLQLNRDSRQSGSKD
jgi:hypothetical protein